VIGVDLNEKKVDLFRQGNATIVEDEIDMIIECTHKLKLSGNKLQNCNLKILNLVDIL